MLNIDWIDNTEENLRTMYKDYVEQIEKDKEKFKKYSNNRCSNISIRFLTKSTIR